jgi:hypothetical protein
MKTIKNFDIFVKKLWEESSIDFLNSFSPNPIDFLDHLDDIVLEYLDDDYEFHSYFTIRKNYKDNESYMMGDGSGKTGHGWELVCSDLTFSQVKSFEDKFFIFEYWNNNNFKDLIDSGNYIPIYRLSFIPKSKNQKLLEIIDNFCKPVLDRIKNELKFNILYVTMASGGYGWVFDDIEIDFSGSSAPLQNRTGIDYLTIHLTL